MPLYICNTKTGALDKKAKEKIAAVITQTHCSVTGAPEEFVHAAFFEDSPHFQLQNRMLRVIGTIRKGRNQAQKEQIAASIHAALVKYSKVEPQLAEVIIRETPASWVLEGGEIMPEPGEEADWLAAQEAKRANERGVQEARVD